MHRGAGSPGGRRRRQLEGWEHPYPFAGRSLRDDQFACGESVPVPSAHSERTSLPPSGLRSFSRPAQGHGCPRPHHRFKVPEAPSTLRHAAGKARAASTFPIGPPPPGTQRAPPAPRAGLFSGTQRAQLAARELFPIGLPLRHAAGAARAACHPGRPASTLIRADRPPLRSGRTASAARKAAGRAEARQAQRGQGWPAERWKGMARRALKSR
ncbi:MAG: hypothetical protein RLZZ440_2802 [Planctomycetota bacterium]